MSAPRFSRRASWEGAPSRFAVRAEAALRSGTPPLDLTESNPTRAGLAWPADALAAVLADAACARYDPDPQGPPPSRRAVAEYLAARGVAVAARRVVLTSSTSEAYSILLKLLCDPGDELLIPAPSYPLHEVLGQLESVRTVRYPLRYDGTWHVDLPALRAALTERTRAVVVVSPANPTGAVVSQEDLDALDALCADRGLALVGDEVFADTAVGGAPSVASARRCLAVHLGGLSKTCGLPQLKAAWMAFAGPDPIIASALERVEMIGDAYLSLSTPAALAVARLLPARERFLGPLRSRLAANEAALRRLVPSGAPLDVLPRAGGWSAVLRIPQRLDEEQVCLELLDAGVLAQPGWFYDFERPGFVVISLLPDPERFRTGAELLVATVTASAARPCRPADP